MKEISIAIASMGLILSLHADTPSDSGLIASKEIWGSGYGEEEAVSPSDDDYDDNQKNEPWPKPKPDAEEGTSIFEPKASKEIFNDPTEGGG